MDERLAHEGEHAVKFRLSDQPVAYEKAVNQLLLLLMGFNVVHWSKEQFALVLAAYGAVSGVLVWNAVTTNRTAEARADQASTLATAQAEVQLHHDLGLLTLDAAPKPPPKPRRPPAKKAKA